MAAAATITAEEVGGDCLRLCGEFILPLLTRLR